MVRVRVRVGRKVGVRTQARLRAMRKVCEPRRVCVHAVGVDELVEDHPRVLHRAGDGGVLDEGDEVKVSGLGQKPLWQSTRRARDQSICRRAAPGFEWSPPTLHSRQGLPVQLPFILAEEELVLLELVHGVIVELVGDGVRRAHQQHSKIVL